LQQAKTTANAPMRGTAHRIHVTGAARSGTTLMLALLATCFDIDGAIAREKRLWRAPLPGRRIVLTKQPQDERLALFLARLDPRLHVIYMLRDPREVIVSVHGADPDRYWSNLRAWLDSVRTAKRHFGHPRVHVVRYDRLMRDPDGVQRALAATVPFLKITRAFSRFHEHAELADPQWRAAMGSIRSLSPDALGAWRNHLPRLKAQLALHGGISDDLIRLGFEQDKSWLALLDKIEPDRTPSRTSEQETRRRRFDHGWRDTVGAAAYLLQRLGVRR
jgi:hypothetical protein